MMATMMRYQGSVRGRVDVIEKRRIADKGRVE